MTGPPIAETLQPPESFPPAALSLPSGAPASLEPPSFDPPWLLGMELPEPPAPGLPGNPDAPERLDELPPATEPPVPLATGASCGGSGLPGACSFVTSRPIVPSENVALTTIRPSLS